MLSTEEMTTNDPTPRKKRRERVNITLSDLARTEGEKLAESMGLKLSQLVEMMLREELQKRGIMPGQRK